MVADADVAQGVHGEVGVLGAGGAEAKAQVREAGGIHDAGRDRHRAGDRQAELRGGLVRHRQGAGQLLRRGQQLVPVTDAQPAHVEPVEHHAVCPEGECQFQSLAQRGDVQARGHEYGDHLPSLELDVHDRLGDAVEGAGHPATGQPGGHGARQAVERHLEEGDAGTQQRRDARLGEQRAVGDHVHAGAQIARADDQLLQVGAQQRLAAGEGEQSAAALAHRLADQSLRIGGIQFAAGVGRVCLPDVVAEEAGLVAPLGYLEKEHALARRPAQSTQNAHGRLSSRKIQATNHERWPACRPGLRSLVVGSNSSRMSSAFS